MVTLRDVKNFLDDCKNDYCITTKMNDKCLELYRFDGNLDDDIMVAKIYPDFKIKTLDGSIAPFNDGDGYFDSIQYATIKDYVYAILGNIKTLIAEDASVLEEHIACIDDIIKTYSMKAIKVTTCNGHEY